MFKSKELLKLINIFRGKCLYQVCTSEGTTEEWTAGEDVLIYESEFITTQIRLRGR